MAKGAGKPKQQPKPAKVAKMPPPKPETKAPTKKK